MNTSNFTGRTHRTLVSAFGPYGQRGLYAEPEPMHPADKIIVWAMCIGLVVVGVMVVA